MSPANPLLVEAWRGLSGSAEASRGQLGWLLLQAAVLMLAWPWRSMQAVLLDDQPPRALLAVVVALGVCVSLAGVRAGAQAAPLPGEHPLQAWVASTPLALGRILRGWLAGQVLRLLHMLLLSAPLLLAAFAVSAADAAALGTLLLATALAGLFYRLCGAVVHLLAAGREQGGLVALYGLVFATWALAALFLPAMVRIARRLRIVSRMPPTSPAVIRLV